MTNSQDMLNNGEAECSKSINFLVIASVAWAVWKSRNDWVFNNKTYQISQGISL